MNQSIFVLDRDSEMADALAKGLARCGFSVLGTSDPEEILQKIGPYDLLLCDDQLPGITGLEVAQQAYAQGWRGPLLLLSGQTAELKKNPRHPLLLMILEKPYSTEELLKNLHLATAC